MKEDKILHILVAAGGTGGHLFPAIAVTEQLKDLTNGKIKFSFIGTSDKIEARVVPELGHTFIPIKLRGLTNKISFRNIKIPFQILYAVAKCKKLLKKEKIDAVLCAGAYLSFPPGLAAKSTGTPLILMESNVNPGKAIKMLSEKADLICTSFESSVDYFPAHLRKKIKFTGNPVRKSIIKSINRTEAAQKFGIDPNKKTILIFGGSLGALSINNAVVRNLRNFAEKDYQVIWQSGKNFKVPKKIPKNVINIEFIDDMASAYSACDLVVSRSGAASVSEIAIAGKPAILVPLPSASNNEQENNAIAFEKNKAAIMVKNNEIESRLFEIIESFILNSDDLNIYAQNAASMARPNAGKACAEEILKLLNL